MKNLILLFLGMWLTSCVNQESVNSVSEINQILEKVANKHKCKLTYQIFLSEEESNPLSLTLHNSIDYTATVGSIIEDCYSELSKKGIYYDRYILKNSQGVLGMDISRSDLEKAINCKPTANNVMTSLADKKFTTVREELDTNFFKQKDIDLVQKYCEEKFNGKYRYIGFEIAKENGHTYCAYVAFIDTTFVSTTVNLSNNNCKIFGLNF
jgi:hypothetical protein